MEQIKNIIVTGGAGYIGSHTVTALSKAGYRAIIVDDFRNSYQSVVESLNEICEITPLVYKVDCTSKLLMSQIFDTHEIEGVIHFAAYKSVEESFNKPVEYFTNNMNSLFLITELMQQYGVQKLVFSSSCTVYGEPDQIVVAEDCALKMAKSPYGYTKQVGEDFLKFYVQSANCLVKPIILRYFNPIGAHPSGLIGELPIDKPRNLVPLICQSAAEMTDPIKVYGIDYDTKDGSCVRDFIHVLDLATAHLSALEHAGTMEEPYDIFNVGTGNGTSVLELIEKFEAVNGVKVPHIVGERRNGDIVKIYADNQKITNKLNWKPKFSISESLRDSWNWQLSLINTSVL
ncbi:MAG: UDP-glucose 4-epimerase [Marivirga sp.]|jgi:UDP-glucose 4-epimerase